MPTCRRIMEENSGKKEKKSLPFLAIGIVWLVLGFLIPFGLTYRLASNPYSPGVPTRSEPAERTVSDATEEAKRSGLVGALVAAFILLIWKTDRLIFSRDKDLENNARVKSLSASWLSPSGWSGPSRAISCSGSMMRLTISHPRCPGCPREKV